MTSIQNTTSSLLSTSPPTPTAKPPSYRSVSPTPPAYKSFLTIQDLYIRYAPLNKLHQRPTPTVLPVMTIDDLYTKFHKPKKTPTPPPTQDPPEPAPYKGLTEEQNQQIIDYVNMNMSKLSIQLPTFQLPTCKPSTSKPPTSKNKSNGKSKKARGRNVKTG